MTKKGLISCLVAATMLLSTGCGGNSATGGNAKGYISQKVLDVKELGEGFNPKYLPDAASIKQQSGTVHVVLDFDGTQHGWEKVAKEYERLHSNKVDVVINTDYSGTMYSEKIVSELQNTKTDWDIVQGNL